MNVRILPSAVADLAGGADFYEMQRPGLGRYFTYCRISDIESLRVYGGIHVRENGFHRCASKRFPFAIYYQVADQTVDVFAVWDCRRNPESIRKILASFPPSTQAPG